MQAREAVCGALRAALNDDSCGAACELPGDPSSSERRCLVAFSGGLDSSVLLHALVHYVLPDAGDARSPALRYSEVLALHANHALQTQAEGWSRHCQEQCAAWGVALHTRKLVIHETGQGLEAAARDARYTWFEEHLAPGDQLLLAHHQDDQAETLLLRLLRGAGPDGLAAMPERRELGAGWLLRPLLALPNSVLLRYAREQGLRWLTDPSNADLRFDRNYLRKEILPRFEERWPGYRKTFARTARLMRDVAAPQSQETLPLSFSAVGDPGFPLAAMPEDAVFAARALRGWLRDRGLEMPPEAQLQEFLRQLVHGRSAQLATSKWTLQRFREAAYVYPTGAVSPPDHQEVQPGQCLLVPDVGSIRVCASPNRPTNGGALTIGVREGGERFSDQENMHRSLKAVFQHHGVPPWWRDRVPLLRASPADGGELLAVGSFARSPAAVAAGVELDWQPAVLGVNERGRVEFWTGEAGVKRVLD